MAAYLSWVLVIRNTAHFLLQAYKISTIGYIPTAVLHWHSS